MTEDRSPRHAASLRLPAPPEDGGGESDAFPRIPSRSPERGSHDQPGRTHPAPRLAAVTAIAALVGALLGSGTMLAYSERQVAEPPLSESGQEGSSVVAPTVDVQEEQPVDRVSAIAAAIIPTVVQVDVEGGGPLGAGTGNGSGVVYRSDGHILTNNHVVQGADLVEVVLADGSRLEASVVGTDPENDLAVVHVDRTDLPAIQVRDSSQLAIGELAVAVGSPFGLEGTVTSGVVSAVNRNIPVGGPGGPAMTMFNVIQTDAPINPGNSGGPLVGGDAKLIGINSAILTTGGSPGNAGVGFAIPASTAVAIADELIANGFVRHPLLGVEGEDVSEQLAERLAVDKGAYVRQVQPDTPAAGAGLQAEDVIVAIGEMAITSMTDLVVAVRARSVGENVTVTYIREGTEKTAEVTLAERPRAQP